MDQEAVGGEVTARSQGPQRVALLIMFVGLMLVTGAMVFMARRDAIFPADDKRYDVTETWLAPAASLCPQLDARSPVGLLEACVQRLTLAGEKRTPGLEPLALPSLVQMPVNSYARFTDLLRERHLTAALAALEGRKPLLLGFRLPRRLFTADTMGANPNVLVLSILEDAHICYLGRCPSFANVNTPMALKFPLFAPPPTGAEADGLVDVWMVLSDPFSPLGLGMEMGLFVAAPRDMLSVDRVHVPLLRAAKLMSAILLLGIALMALLYAALWTDFIDFSAFCGLATMLFMENIAFVMISLQSLDTLQFERRMLVAVAFRLNVLVASVFFAVSTLRPHALKFWISWACTALFSIGIAYVAVKFLNLRSYSSPHFVGIDLVDLMLPGAIVVVGGHRIRRRMLADQALGQERASDAGRRFRGQLIFAGSTVLTAVPHLLQSVQMQNGLWTYDLTALTGLSLIPLFAMLLYVSSSTYRIRAEAYKKNLFEMAKQAAVGEMVQMLAHDVRKPFSMLRMGMDMLARARSYGDMRQTMEILSPQVGKALKAVTAMLEDIMAVSSSPTLNRGPIEAEALINQCLQEIFQVRRLDSIEFSYNFQQTKKLNGDAERLMRVLNNIVENAAQAMHGSGQIRFALRDWAGRFVELTIGNSGSFIPPADLARIFDTFYTKGKKDGTGLGLAVCKRFVALHGGTIHCRSNAQIGVEFILRLPADEAAAEHLGEGELPRTSQAVVTPVALVQARSEEGLNSPMSDHEESDLALFTDWVKGRGRPLKVLIVEDEAIYSAGLIVLLQSYSAIHWVDAHVVQQAHDALDMAQSLRPDVIISDVDLGPLSITGFELCKRLHTAGLSRYICMHSNRIMPGDERRAREAGAAALLPKPMRRQQLLEILRQAVQAAPAPDHVELPFTQDLVAIVDDDLFMLEAWTATLKPVGTVAFTTTAAFWDWARSHNADFSRLKVVVTDYYLEADEDGIAFARELRPMTKALIVMATDAHDSAPADGAVDAVIEKNPLTLGELLALDPQYALLKGG